MEPVVHDVYGKTAFLSLQDTRRQVTFANSAVQPFLTAITNFESCAKPLDVLYHRPIQVWNADFETVCHGELVRVHEKLVRQRGANFKKLKTTQFICVRHLWNQTAPVVSELIAISPWKCIIPKESLYDACWR